MLENVVEIVPKIYPKKIQEEISWYNLLLHANSSAGVIRPGNMKRGLQCASDLGHFNEFNLLSVNELIVTDSSIERKIKHRCYGETPLASVKPAHSPFCFPIVSIHIALRPFRWGDRWHRGPCTCGSSSSGSPLELYLLALAQAIPSAAAPAWAKLRTADTSFLRMLRSNRVSCVGNDSFTGLSSVRLLSLYDNQITTVAPGSFDTLHSLSTL